MANSLQNLGAKTREFLERRKREKQMEQERDRLEEKELRRDNIKYYEQEAKQRAIEHEKNKAFNIMNNKSVKLHQRIKAMNEYYKDHTRPKINSGFQDISDHIYLTKYKRDMKMEKLNTLKTILKEEKMRKQMENMHRTQHLKNTSKARDILKQTRNRLGIKRAY